MDDRDRLLFTAGGYRLRVLPGESDVEQFELLLAEASGDCPARCAELLRAALRIWRGASYQDLDVEALAAEVERLSERRLAPWNSCTPPNSPMIATWRSSPSCSTRCASTRSGSGCTRC